MTVFTEDILHAPADEIVCYCGNVTKGQILQGIRMGNQDLPSLKAETGACGDSCAEVNPRGRCCTPEIVRLLKQECGTLPPIS